MESKAYESNNEDLLSSGVTPNGGMYFLKQNEGKLELNQLHNNHLSS